MLKKDKFSDASKDLLSLGEVHEEILEKKQLEKQSIIPIIMIAIGIVLIIIGTFYTNIDKFIKSITPKKEVKEVVKEEGVTYLTCEYKNNDEPLGIEKDTIIKYEFKDNLLKKMTTTLTMNPMENNDDIGSSNIKIYYQKYVDNLKKIKNNGLIINTNNKNDKLIHIVIIDFEKLDINNIPENEYISITNKKDQTYREIKEIEGKAGHICKTT